MVPRSPSPDTNSRAELALFDRIAAELPRPWVGLHSVALAHHASKPWAEVDFVLIGPPGIVCLEVKGGGVSRRGGEWIFHNAQGTQGKKREGPFEQAKTGSFALRDWLCAQDDTFEHVLHGWGVIFPDTTFTVTGPDILHEVVVDERTIEQPIADSIAKITGYWRTKFERTRYFNDLAPDDISRAVQLLRGDFDVELSNVRTIHDTRERLLELTERQRQAVSLMASTPRMWVTGGAGTGKTVLAIDDARRLAARGERVLFVCFNRRLATHLKATLRAGADVTVRTFHSLCHELAGTASQPQPPAAGHVDPFEATVEQALDAALSDEHSYSAIVVDEGQDLCRDSHLDVIDALLEGGLRNGTWRWYSDPNQDVFTRSDDHATQRLVDAGPGRCELDLNCRNTVQVATLAHRLSGIAVPSRGVDGPEPDLLWYADADDARRKARQYLRGQIGAGVDPSTIKVLSTPKGRDLVPDGKLVGDTRISWTTAGTARDLAPRDIEHCNVGSFKGLEADVVLVAPTADDFTDATGRSHLYVGASRAVSTLAVLVPNQLHDDIDFTDER